MATKAKDLEPKDGTTEQGEHDDGKTHSGHKKHSAVAGDPHDTFDAAVDLIAVATKKFCDAGMPGTEAGQAACDLYCNICCK